MKYPKKNGFSLIELLIATALISVSLLSLFRLATNNSYFLILNKNTLIAQNIAKQGKEIIQNITTTRTVPNMTEYLTETNTYLEITKTNNTYDLTITNSPKSFNIKGEPASADDNLQFTRKIQLTEYPLSKNALYLSIEVNWSDEGGKHVKQMEDIVY